MAKYQLTATIIVADEPGIIGVARKKRGGKTNGISDVQDALAELFDLVDGERNPVYKGLKVTSLEVSGTGTGGPI